MKSNIKELVEVAKGKRLTSKFVSEIIDINTERLDYNKKIEVEIIDTFGITKLSELENIIDDLRKKYGNDKNEVEIEINSYEIVVYATITLKETDSQVIERIKKEIKDVRKLQKQAENAISKLAMLEE